MTEIKVAVVGPAQVLSVTIENFFKEYNEVAFVKYSLYQARGTQVYYINPDSLDRARAETLNLGLPLSIGIYLW